MDKAKAGNLDFSQGPARPEARFLVSGLSSARPEARNLKFTRARPGPILKKAGPYHLYCVLNSVSLNCLNLRAKTAYLLSSSLNFCAENTLILKLTHKFPQMQWKSPQRIVALTGPTQLIIGFSLAIAKSASVFIGLCVTVYPLLTSFIRGKGTLFYFTLRQLLSPQMAPNTLPYVRRMMKNFSLTATGQNRARGFQKRPKKFYNHLRTKFLI